MRSYALVLAAAVTGVLAQSGYGDNAVSTPKTSNGIVYVTETVDSCETDTPEQLVTVTNDITVTYCPKCDRRPHTTVYSVVFQSLCTDDDEWYTTPVTHTITETCDEDASWTPGPNHIPQDYTVTVKDCQKCATPGPVTITEPCGCKATSGTPVGPAPTGGSAETGAAVPKSPAATTTPAPGSNGASPPYPIPTSAARAALPTGGAWSNTTTSSTLTPYKAGASANSRVGIVSCLVVVVGAFAVLL